MSLPTMTAALAACIVLGYDPKLKANHDLAMARLKEMGLMPVYVYDSHPVHPTAISEKVQGANPYVYLAYPNEVAIEHQEVIASSSVTAATKRRSGSLSSQSSQCSDTSNATVSNESSLVPAREYNVKITKDEALTYLKTVMSLAQPVAETTLYEQLFVNSSKMKEILEKRFGPLVNTARQIETWINKSNVWGERRVTRKDGIQTEGRLLWVLHDKYLKVNVMHDLIKYHTHLRNHPITNVGYARKSPGKERFEARCALMQKMATRLQNRGLCTKVYISPSSKSDESLMTRDKDADNGKCVHSIAGCLGDMNDLRALLNKKFKPIRLVVIDYAGFSTEPNDIRNFFERFFQIKEMFVDHGTTFELFSREDLLENDDMLSLFDCRSGPKHRAI